MPLPGSAAYQSRRQFVLRLGPAGIVRGFRLSDYWRLDEHHLGEESFTHWPDGSAHKNRMQGNDYVQSQMYLKGVTCSGATMSTGRSSTPT